MQKKKILSLAIATATVVTGLVWVTTATTPEVLDNWDLEICRATDSSECITIQWKNVWATTTWAWPSAPDTSYWNYYQRWDNTPRTEANWLTNYSPSNDAWWWGEDNNGLVYPVENESERQWPCDPWYHVPSKWEWYALMDMWAGSSTNWMLFSNVSQFYTDFQIPFAGYRYGDGSLYDQGDYANLWSSSPYVGDENARYFRMFEYDANAKSYDRRTVGFPVRCFKDSALGSSSSEGGDGSGWNSEIIVNIWQFNNWQNTCTWQDFIFSGIFASPTTITRNLVKTFQCAFGEMWQKAVTLQLQWDLTDWSGNVISSWNVKIKNSAWVWTPAWVKWTAVSTDEYTWLNKTITLFNKAENIIWIAEWTWIDIQIEIPWWTPDGTYNGTLILSY